jgi:hypothetical protein
MKSTRPRKTKNKTHTLVKGHQRADGAFVKEHMRVLPIRKKPLDPEQPDLPKKKTS